MTPEGYDLAVLREVYTPEIIEWISTRAKSDKGFSLLHQTLTGAHRRIRRFYYRIKVRRVAKAMKSELSDDFSDPGELQ